MPISDNQLISNAVRTSLMNSIRNGRISQEDGVSMFYDTFGYKYDLIYEDFERAYKRQDVAKRIIDATVDYTWKELPEIIDEEENANEDITGANPSNNVRLLKNYRKRFQKEASTNATDNQYTQFEQGVFELFKKFPMLRLFKKVDRLNCIGRYAVMVIGTKEGELSEELSIGVSVDDIAYIHVFSERDATIEEFETDRTNERFGLPKTYRIINNEKGSAGTSSLSTTVHWTRVIHVAEDLVDSEVYGTPKLEAVYNTLQDLMKVVGGSAEMFWLAAYQGLVFNIKDDYELTLDDEQRMTQQIENYVNKLQRFMQTKGVEVQSLSSQVASPTGHFETLIKLISGSSNIPTRILLGSEQGQLAASVDQDAFFSYIGSRRNSFASEDIIRALLNRLVEYGYIEPASNEEYEVKWHVLFEETKQEKLSNARTMVETAKAYDPLGDASRILGKGEVREALELPEEAPDEYDDDYSDIDYDLELLPDDEDDTEPVGQEYDPKYEDYVSLKEVASFLGIGGGTVKKYARNKGLPFYKFGNSYKFRMSEIEQWMQNARNSAMVKNHKQTRYKA